MADGYLTSVQNSTIPLDNMVEDLVGKKLHPLDSDILCKCTDPLACKGHILCRLSVFQVRAKASTPVTIWCVRKENGMKAQCVPMMPSRYFSVSSIWYAKAQFQNHNANDQKSGDSLRNSPYEAIMWKTTWFLHFNSLYDRPSSVSCVSCLVSIFDRIREQPTPGLGLHMTGSVPLPFPAYLSCKSTASQQGLSRWDPPRKF